MNRRGLRFLLVLLVASVSGVALTARAGAEGLPDGTEWRLEQPPAPEPPAGVEEGTALGLPIGLGKIGDIEFWAPDRGALITAGNGSTIEPGVWIYDGESWRELTRNEVCGATDGRIAWAGEDEFWTISNGRPGQAPGPNGDLPPLEDDTLCHFVAPKGPNGEQLPFEVAASYASLAFQSTSYQAMNAAACIDPDDCWFGGEALPAPAVGSFQLHWNGSTLAPEPYLPEGHAVEDMSVFNGDIFESVQLLESDRVIEQHRERPPLHLINGEGVDTPIVEQELPEQPEEALYGPNESPFSLGYLRLGADEDELWAAAGTVPKPADRKGEEHAGVTVLRYSRLQYSHGSEQPTEAVTPSWSTVIGPATEPSGTELFPGELVGSTPTGDVVVNSIAPEPDTDSAWIALESQREATNSTPSPLARATLAQVSADGNVSKWAPAGGGEPSDELELPSAKGAAAHVVCPAAHDCWVATTAGWLYHLSTQAEREHPQRDGDPAFEDPADVVTHRPADEGVPQQESDALPVDDSGLTESRTGQEKPSVAPVVEPFALVSLPLLSHERTRLRHGTELEFSFHLAVKARVRLLAERRHSVVASTPTRTLKAGNRSLLLRLNVKRWPTKLDLQTHALAPLPTASTRENSGATDTVSYSLAFPETHALVGSGLLGSGLLP
jgi:hypothetical protein